MSAWETSGQSDKWYTPKYIFDAMGGVMFDLDVAAPNGRSAPRSLPRVDQQQQPIAHDWRGFVWMNPPYGGRNALAPWLEKFIGHGNGICIVPDRTSAPWFQAAAPRMDGALFLSPKVQFERPDGSLGKSPGAGSVLFYVGPQGRRHVEVAKALGWLALPVVA